MQSVERLRECLDYNPDTGVFTFKVALGKKIRPGKIAGWVSSFGYLIITIDGVDYRANRAAYAIVTGALPKGLVDHINTDKLDNRWKNLRLADKSKNSMNTGLKSSNTSGYKGVSWCRYREKWVCQVGLNNKNYFGGAFSDIKDASEAAVALRNKLHGEFARHE